MSRKSKNKNKLSGGKYQQGVKEFLDQQFSEKITGQSVLIQKRQHPFCGVIHEKRVQEFCDETFSDRD